MDGGLLGWIGIGASFGLSALGATIGMVFNGPAVIGAWKKCYLQNKPAPFILLVFAATCLSNVIYGFIIMNALVGTGSTAAIAAHVALNSQKFFVLGLSAGLSIGGVAITQAVCSACAAEAFAETGKGFGNFLMVIGIAETISLFSMVFTLLLA